MNEDKLSTIFELIHVYFPQTTDGLMETNQQSTAVQTTPEQTTQEQAVAIMKRLVADKRQAK